MSMKGKIIAAVVVVAVAAGGYVTWNHFSNGDAERQVQTTTAQKRTIEQVVTATGRLEPKEFVDVGAQVSGQLDAIHVEVGDEVEQGDLLAEIDPTVLEARLDATRAQLKHQQAQMREREAQLELAEINYRRQQRLMEQNSTSEEAVESAAATARAEAARVDAIEAQMEQTESSLRADEANLNYTRIFAPMTGTVVNIQARRGQTLNASQTTPTIMTIADMSVMRVQAQVSEADVGRLTPGMPVYFTTLGNRTQRFDSNLIMVEPTPEVENNVVLYFALFDVPNPGTRLLPQMTTQVFFVVERAEDAVSLPVAAVRPRGPGQAEVQVLRNGQPETVTVRTGVSDRVHIEIVDGIREGDEVLIPRGPAGAQGGGPGGMRFR